MENKEITPHPETILVPVDYSDCSVLACRYAAKIASKSKGRIFLFHAFYSPAFDMIELTGSLNTQQQLREDVTEKLIEGEQEELNRFIDKILTYKEFKNYNQSDISSALKPGLARDEIISYAHVCGATMVIMGTRGAHKKNVSILGSITEHVIMKLKLPVIAIPEDYTFVGEENMRKLVYLTDFDESDFASIKHLMQFADLFQMSIYCIHLASKEDKWESLKMEGLKEYFKSVYGKDSVQCQIIPQSINLLQTLDDFAVANRINLIALTHRKRKLIEMVFKPSVTKKIFYHTNIPLMVFHE